MTTQKWTTKNEIDFIKGLGTHSRTDRVGRKTRGELLALYLAGALKRDRWAGMDREQVLRFAREAIDLETAN